MLGTIYVHVNKINGKCYVGQTVNPESRWYPRSYTHCRRFNSAIKHHGWNSFDHIVLLRKEMTNEEMDAHEQVWIAVLRTTEKEFGYNIAVGGSGSAGYPRPPFSEETKRKISESHKGKKFSAETLQKMSEAGKKRAFSEAHRQKISASCLGKKKNPFSDEHKKNLRDSHLGKKLPLEQIEKIRKAMLAFRQRKREALIGVTTTGRESECGIGRNAVHQPR